MSGCGLIVMRVEINEGDTSYLLILLFIINVFLNTSVTKRSRKHCSSQQLGIVH